MLPLFTHLGVEVVDERPYEIRRSDGAERLRLRLRAQGARGRRSWTGPEPRRRARAVPGRVRRRLGRARRERRLQRAGPRRRAHLAPGRRSCAPWPSTCARPGSTFSQEYVVGALVSNVGAGRGARRAVRGAVRPRPVRHATGTPRRSARPPRTSGSSRSRRPRRRSRASTTTGSSAPSWASSGPPCARATTSTTPARRPSAGAEALRQLQARPAWRCRACRRPGRCSRSGSTRPRVEGVHLRFGKVARGGLRWSDRREDFRTEVLGLVKAQMVKNAVIVPTGAKGGFFAKALPDPTVDREAWLAEGIAALQAVHLGDAGHHRQPASATDGRCRPQRVVRHDGDDTYLVVAADKGTATFSDIANGVAQAYGFWLGDAFASGGSAGYDHKAMGITARGAWESVKRHFRELGVDTQTAGLHRGGRRRHERRRVRQRHAAVRAHPAGRGVRPPAHLPGPRPRCGRRPTRSANGCSTCPARPGPTTTPR